MLQEQGFVTPTGLRRDTIRRAISSRLLSSVLIGTGITLVLTLIMVVVFWLLNPVHLFALITHISVIWLFLPATLLLASLLAMLIAKPVALLIYLRSVHTAQEEYNRLYTPLKALTNIRKPVEDFQRNGATPVALREEQVSILDLIEYQDDHQLILGVPGAGKTMALQVYQYHISLQPLAQVLARGRIPIYVPMKNYSLFLKKQLHRTAPERAGVAGDSLQATILDFLYESDLPSMRHLRGYLPELSRQGRLLLLCDGLNEVDSNYMARVSEELVWWMRDTRNHLVMTCREVDYREQQEFVQLVEEGHAARAVIYPLQPDQVSEFVERYIERQDKNWQHTAGQIVQVIDRSRLRYHCTNPMMLYTLMGIIDKIGIERGRQIDTRGCLLREYVKQLIEYEQGQVKWNRRAPAEREVVRFLSEVACAARWANDRNAIQLRISSPPPGTEGRRVRVNFDELADELQYWLDEHPAPGPFVEESGADTAQEPYSDLAQLVQFALSAALIDISPGGVLSFRHELIAEYFVAEYFFSADGKIYSPPRPLREDLLENVGRWSEPVAIWAGLLEKPLVLAEHFGTAGRTNPAYVLQALALGLVCVGVLWSPPQMGIQPPILLPPGIEEALSIAVRNRAAREELARIFTRCAEEGGQEVYRSLLPLIMVDGVDDLLTLLDQNIVPELLFSHLQDAVDNVAYEAQVKRLTRVLGRFGGVVVERAAQLCQPASGRSSRLRAATINILGGTKDLRAIDPLIARLSDADAFIVERSTNALVRLGPELTLTRILQELEKRGPLMLRVHQAALTILGRFLDEQDVRQQVPLIQYQRVLETLVPILTSNYQAEPQVQQQALEILVGQGSATTGAGARDNRWEKVIEALIRYLPSQNEVAARNVMLALEDIGPIATSYLLPLMEQPSDVLRMRVVEILGEVRDPHALPPLLRLVNDPAAIVQQQVAQTLLIYSPDSISGLIDLVLMDSSDAVAERAAQILSSVGQPAVESITPVLFHVVPGRTRLLVQVLAHIQDVESVSALITLLPISQVEPLLTIAIVRALSQFVEKRVVAPLLSVLASANPQLYEEAINALSQLGVVALDELVAALNSPLDSIVAVRVRRVLLGMAPFPGELLVSLLAQCSEMQAQQVMLICKTQGVDAAQALVRHLLEPDERVRQYVQATLGDMAGPVVVPALLDVLGQPALRKAAGAFLLKYPDAAISPLVDLLGERERGDTAAQILPLFGPRVLRPLISGLDDQRSVAREYAQRIIVTLVRQNQQTEDILHQVVHLFNPALPARARDILLRVLTNELADICIPALLEGLEDAHLIDDVAEAFAALMRRESLQPVVLDNLLQALYIEERRRGAEAALVSIGALAVVPVGKLITDANVAVAKAARDILGEIGVPAFSFIWMAHSDRSNPARRAAAMDIFHKMRTEVIKDELVTLLVSDRPDDIAMAVILLMERIHDEAQQHYADREMIPELINYIQTHGVEQTNVRLIALLLMLDEQTIADHLVQTLDDYPQHRRQLFYTFLLLGEKTQEALLAVFKDPETSVELRAEIAAVLGMTIASDTVADYAQRLSTYGLSVSRSNILAPDQLAIALRSLGGLLAGGYWNVRKIQELRDASKGGGPAYELFNMLLGWRYEPQLAQLQNTLQDEREAHRQAIKELTARIVVDQDKIRSLEQDLTQVRREHGTRGDELQQVASEKEALGATVGQITQERDALRAAAQQLAQEKAALGKGLEQATQEKNILIARLERTLQEKKLLTDQNERLIQKVNQPGVE